MKIFLWIFTIVGLLPVTAISILHITSWLALRRQIASESNDGEGGFTLITRSYIQFGGSAAPTNLSTHAWPSVLVLAGVVCCVVGLLYLIPRYPQRVYGDGYDHFEPMIKRVMSSSRDDASFIVSARSGNEGLLVMRVETGYELHVFRDSSDGRLAELKAFFLDRGVHPVNEHSTHDDHFGTDTSHLAFPLPGDSKETADLCIHVFRDVFGVKDNEAMEFTLEH